jgi:hypothetical protein
VTNILFKIINFQPLLYGLWGSQWGNLKSVDWFMILENYFSNFFFKNLQKVFQILFFKNLQKVFQILFFKNLQKVFQILFFPKY